MHKIYKKIYIQFFLNYTLLYLFSIFYTRFFNSDNFSGIQSIIEFYFTVLYNKFGLEEVYFWFYNTYSDDRSIYFF